MPENARIVELGSGNGRDAFYFIENQHEVTAIDQSTAVLEIEHEKLSLTPIQERLTIVQDDFVAMDYSRFSTANVFYSRFTLHAIGLEEEQKVVTKVYDAMPQDGYFFIEARTINDPLCGQGEHMGGHVYKTDHCRRFIDSQFFLSHVMQLGFKLVYFIESIGLSVYNEEDPVLMRLVLKK